MSFHCRVRKDEINTHHSLYSAFHTALYPSGTLGGGGPVGGAKSFILKPVLPYASVAVRSSGSLEKEDG